MNKSYILVDLDNEQKQLILEKADYLINEEQTKSDLHNKRKKWIRMTLYTIKNIIGELTYHYNRTNDRYESLLLDELTEHLEYYEYMENSKNKARKV